MPNRAGCLGQHAWIGKPTLRQEKVVASTENVPDFIQHHVTERPSKASRASTMGTRHAVSTSHYLASQAAFQILEAGGNAIDAGVCAGLAVEVLEPHMSSVAGVAPIILYHAESASVVSIVGLGVWPKAASCAFFQERYGGAIPKGVHRSIVPAAPDAWITALERYGTMSFGDVAQAAIGFARDGFRMYDYLHEMIVEHLGTYRMWPSSSAIYLQDNEPIEVGRMFRQTDAAGALQYMCDEERAASTKGGRAAGLEAARNAFYKGDIAQTIAKFYKAEGGLLTAEDLAEFRVEVEKPVRTRFLDEDVYSCGPWCQGPMLLQALNLLDPGELRAAGHNSAEYIHQVVEAIKLAAADREAFYGDPRFVDVPMDRLLSADYSQLRRQLIRRDRAWPSTPPSGKDDPAFLELLSSPSGRETGHQESRGDTCYVCVVDRHGNGFSATPSDGSLSSPVVPGIGMIVSGRGYQSWTEPEHPSSVAPGKRPRLTPNPAIAVREGKSVMPFGTPGGDTQIQSMLQTYLNSRVFGMTLQQATDAPRFISFSFPSSFMPHEPEPGLLKLEHPIPDSVSAPLAALGHRVEWWPEWANYGTSVCAAFRSQDGAVEAAADPRRAGYVCIL